MTNIHATIPKDWEQINLERECSFERGTETGADAYNTEGIGDRFIRVVDVTESRDNSVFVDGAHTTKRVKKDDILLTLDGTVGAVIRGLEGIYSTGVRKVSFRDKKNSDRLLYYLLQSTGVQRTIGLYASGSTIKHASSAIPHLTAAVPEQPEEQNNIADVLELVDQAIEKTDALIKKYERVRTGMMQDLFRYGIDEKGQMRSEKTHKFKSSLFGKIPAEWEIRELGSIAQVQRGKFQHRPRNDPRFYGGSIPFVQTGDVAASGRTLKLFSQTLNERGLRVSRIFPKGTLIMTIAANIGDIAIADFEMAFPDSLVGINVSEAIDNNFLFYFLVTRKYHLNSIATESAQKNINLEVLNPSLVLLPSVDEQKRIAVVLTGLDEKISREVQYVDKILAIKRGMMADLLTGTVRTVEK